MPTEPTMAYVRQQERQTADSQPMTVYCLLCPKWKAVGTAAVTRAASEAHRKKHHPELVGKKVVKKRRAFSAAMTAEREAEIEQERRRRMRALGISSD